MPSINGARNGSFSAGIQGGSGGEMKGDFSAHFPPALCLRLSFIPLRSFFFYVRCRRGSSFSPPPCHLHFFEETSFVYIYNYPPPPVISFRLFTSALQVENVIYHIFLLEFLTLLLLSLPLSFLPKTLSLIQVVNFIFFVC